MILNLALELGLRKSLCDRANLHLNVLMVDEGFSYVLKKETLQAFVQILEEDCNIETVGLITHNSELIEKLDLGVGCRTEPSIIKITLQLLKSLHSQV